MEAAAGEAADSDMYSDGAGASPESLRPASTSTEAPEPARKKFPEVILFQLYSRLLIESFVQFFIAELTPCFKLLLLLMSFFFLSRMAIMS